MEVDLNKEKWLGETRPISNATLMEWAHYVKVMREKLTENDMSPESDLWNDFLNNFEQDIRRMVTRAVPEPKIVDVKV
jgi:hypothetical protein